MTKIEIYKESFSLFICTHKIPFLFIGTFHYDMSGHEGGGEQGSVTIPIP